MPTIVFTYSPVECASLEEWKKDTAEPSAEIQQVLDLWL
jgi:hypothetical protein